MKRAALGLMTAALLLAFAGLAVAQSSPSISRTSSSSTVRIAAYAFIAEARSADRATQLDALERVQTMVSQGHLSPTQAATAETVLTDLVYSGVSHPIVTGNAVINSFPYLRMMACRLLGRLRGRESEAVLMEVLRNDPEPMVLSEAVYQLGRIGKNPRNEVSKTIAFALVHANARRADNNLAFSSLLAFEYLAQSNHGLTDPLVYEAISEIQTGDYVLSVKEKAAQVLDRLRSFE